MEVKEIEDLINNYGDVIYGFCIKLTFNKIDADDLYQQTFLKALEIKEKIDIHNNPKNFLISVAIGIWKNHRRKLSRRQGIINAVSIEQAEFDIQDKNVDIFQITYNKELENKITILVNSLDDKFRLPILMYYNLEMSIKDIASALKLPQGTVKSRLNRAKQVIKQKLIERGYDYYE